MKNGLLPPPAIPPEMASEVWAEMIDTGEVLVRAGIASRNAPEQVEQKYREWNARELRDHDQRLEKLLTQLTQREKRRAG